MRDFSIQYQLCNVVDIIMICKIYEHETVTFPPIIIMTDFQQLGIWPMAFCWVTIMVTMTRVTRSVPVQCSRGDSPALHNINDRCLVSVSIYHLLFKITSPGSFFWNTANISMWITHFITKSVHVITEVKGFWLKTPYMICGITHLYLNLSLSL